MLWKQKGNSQLVAKKNYNEIRKPRARQTRRKQKQGKIAEITCQIQKFIILWMTDKMVWLQRPVNGLTAQLGHKNPPGCKNAFITNIV